MQFRTWRIVGGLVAGLSLGACFDDGSGAEESGSDGTEGGTTSASGSSTGSGGSGSSTSAADGSSGGSNSSTTGGEDDTGDTGSSSDGGESSSGTGTSEGTSEGTTTGSGEGSESGSTESGSEGSTTTTGDESSSGSESSESSESGSMGVLGDDCDAPFSIEELPFSTAADTLDFTPSFSFGSGICPGESAGYGLAAPDVAYTFVPGADGIYGFELVPQYDASLYVLGTCGDSGTCLHASQTTGNAREAFALDLSVGVEYTVVVDGFSNVAAGNGGAFMLAIDALEERTFSNEADLAIPDDAYDGSIDSMVCLGVNVPASATGHDTLFDMDVLVEVTHTFVGDVVIKLVEPGGQIVTLMSRPGATETADDGAEDLVGHTAEISSAYPVRFGEGLPTDAEQMGAPPLLTDEIVCLDDSRCDYQPNPGAAGGPRLGELGGSSTNGIWQLCVGDAYAEDLGNLSGVSLRLRTRS